MELMHPWIIIVCLIISIIILFIKLNKKNKYTDGKKVANTNFIKSTEYYKAKVRKYKIVTTIMKSISVVLIVITSFLIARVITIETKSEEKYNRDIIIGLDISLSENEVNLNLIRKFKKIIPNIEGDRIGIVIFNTAPIVFCPLTDDYDYINECLDELEKQILYVINNGNYVPTNIDEAFTFWYGGTVANSETRGSSLIGDGLAGTVYSFPDLKTNSERTRIIIFATDNDLAGTSMISLEEACSICKKYGVNVYAYCPTVEMNVYTSKEKIAQYKAAIEKNAGGKFYTGNLDKMTSSIVDEIKDTKASLINLSKKTIITDHPQVFFVILVILFVILIIIEKINKI